jgi:hypothetical protein
MHGFAEVLKRNWPEVKAAIELPWSNGRAEGHVIRLKLIRRKNHSGRMTQKKHLDKRESLPPKVGRNSPFPQP